MAIKNTKLGGTDWTSEELLSADLNDTMDATTTNFGYLGEVRMFALSMSGAVTKAALQSKGWAICDGTTPATQGISDPTIETTPDLQEKFLRMSNDESSGSTGGADSEAHNHQWLTGRVGNSGANIDSNYGAGGGDAGGSYNSGGSNVSLESDGTSLQEPNYTDNYTVNTVPAYYEVAYFMKVRTL